MKKKLFTLFSILLSLSIPIFAEDRSVINGNSHLNNGKYESLEINGKLTFNDLLIKDSFVTNGSVHGKNLKCHTMKSNGSVDVDGLEAQGVESHGSFSGKNIDITGESKFNGSLEIENGKLNNIQIASTRSTITTTQVNGSIHIKKVSKGWSFFGFKSHKSSPQILELKGNSLVSGDVVFEENGEVHLLDDAKVKGKILNAKVIQK